MDFLITSVVVVLVIAAPLLILVWYQRRLRTRLEAVGVSTAVTEIGWSDVQPGDRLVWGDRSVTVEAAIRCREERNHRVFGWLWYLVSGGGLVEYRAGQISVFDPPEIYDAESEQFDLLGGPRGALAAFESGSRLSWEPAAFGWQDQTYSVSGTGAFQAWVAGDVAGRAVWPHLGGRQSDNVYFALQRDGEEETAEESAGDVLLGIWTDAIALHPLRERISSDSARIIRPEENSTEEKG